MRMIVLTLLLVGCDYQAIPGEPQYASCYWRTVMKGFKDDAKPIWSDEKTLMCFPNEASCQEDHDGHHPGYLPPYQSECKRHQVMP